MLTFQIIMWAKQKLFATYGGDVEKNEQQDSSDM